MNTVNFIGFWIIIIGLFAAIFYGGDRPWIVLGRIAGMVAVLLFILFFMFGAQPRVIG